MRADVSVPWLPREAIAAAAGRLALGDAVSDWAAKWFARGGASVAGPTVVTGDTALPGEVMELDDGLMLATPHDAIAALGLSMFGEPGEATTAADRAAIDAVAEQALGDLRHRAAQLAGLPRDAAWRARNAAPGEAGYTFTISTRRAAALTLFVADRLLISGIRARLRPVPATEALGDVAAGLAPQRISLSARLGECRLATGELAGLAAGDVVILDRFLTDPADLVIDRVPQRAACTISAGTDHLDLTLA